MTMKKLLVAAAYLTLGCVMTSGADAANHATESVPFMAPVLVSKDVTPLLNAHGKPAALIIKSLYFNTSGLKAEVKVKCLTCKGSTFGPLASVLRHQLPLGTRIAVALYLPNGVGRYLVLQNLLSDHQSVGSEPCLPPERLTPTSCASLRSRYAINPVRFKLTVTTRGGGSGSVAANGGIRCPGTCSERYLQGSTVTLVAQPAPGSAFAGWTGACAGVGTCTITLNADAAITATFVPSTYTLSVADIGTGMGTVSDAGNVIDCPTTCTGIFPAGSTIALTATPSAGSRFAGWTGACSGNGVCDVTLSSAAAVTADFVPADYTLSVDTLGTGAGAVTSSGGLACPGTCSASYPAGTTVSLSAVPSAGSTFAGWTGACTGVGTCTVTVDANESVTASFAVQTSGQTYTEYPGGDTQTWSDYSDAGGQAGPLLPAFAAVQVTCRVQGFPVDTTTANPQGDVWWYEVASNGSNNQYFASADPFYNNGSDTGSLVGTPLFDPSVPTC
jgi:Divergent InlB B-repeat domain